jgi:hypothetical protein
VARRLLSTRDLNRALLARQLLLDRRQLPLANAVERIGGLQSQYAPSAYIGLWSRLPGFERAGLTRALERRRVVQETLMRTTIHICLGAGLPAVRGGRRGAAASVVAEGRPVSRASGARVRRG